MEYAIIRRSTDKNRIESVEIRELSTTAAENLSEIAAVVAMTPNFGGTSTVYHERRMSQAFVNYDELYELARRTVQHDGRNGWLS